MARRSNRGGDRTPSSPSTFSSFGSASSRTDGSLSGEFRAEDRHGQATELNTAAQGLGTDSPVQPSNNSSPGAPAFLGEDPFRPTERPTEPNTAGALGGPGPDGPMLPGNETDVTLQAIYELTGDPLVLGLMRNNHGQGLG